MQDDDPLAQYRLTPEQIAAATGKPAKRKRMPRSTGPFAMVPVPWIYHVAAAIHEKRAAVVFAICYLMRFGDQAVRVTAPAMREAGVSTRTRNRALRALEAAGFARVEWDDRRGPLVEWLNGRRTLPTAVADALAKAAPSAPKGMCRPAEILALLPPRAGAPRTAKALLRLLRGVDPGYVVVRGGYRWIVLDPSVAVSMPTWRT
jgi:hypothetical protein